MAFFPKEQSMRNVAVLLIVLSAFSLRIAGLGQDSSIATVEGLVVDAGTNTPLVGVRIQFQPGNLRTTTGDQGQFEVGLSPGRYILTTERAGYAGARLAGRKMPGNNGLPLTLRAGQSLRRVIALDPTGIVAGRVLDAEGQPARVVNIIPVRSVHDDFGRRIFRYFPAVQSNDLGEYRIATLDPGHYWLKFEPRPTRLGETASRTFLASYYPGVTDFSGAQTIN